MSDDTADRATDNRQVESFGSLKRRIAALEAALTWYADPATYDAIGPLGTVKGGAWQLREDGGQRARDALAEKGDINA